MVPRLYAHTLPGAPVAKRVAAIECLGRYAKMRPDAAAALLRAMRSRDGDAARAAMRALLPIAGDLRQPLERVLFDRDPALRKNAAFVLENF